MNSWRTWNISTAIVVACVWQQSQSDHSETKTEKRKERKRGGRWMGQREALLHSKLDTLILMDYILNITLIWYPLIPNIFSHYRSYLVCNPPPLFNSIFAMGVKIWILAISNWVKGLYMFWMFTLNVLRKRETIENKTNTRKKKNKVLKITFSWKLCYLLSFLMTMLYLEKLWFLYPWKYIYKYIYIYIYTHI